MKLKGFTLIELVMVIVLLGIVSASAFVAISSYKCHYLMAAAEKLSSDLRYARNLALASSKWHGAVFSGNTYTVYETDGVNDIPISNPEREGEDFIINISDNYDDVSISSVNIASGNKVEFDPYGVPFSDKTGVPISSNGFVSLLKGGNCVVVTISPTSGAVTIQ